MNHLAFLAAVLVFLVSPGAAPGEGDCAEFNELLDATYNFKPAELTVEEEEAKRAAMDKVWDAVKANPAELRPCLDRALAEREGDAWFVFDASNLLVAMDPSPETKQLQVRAFARVDLADVNQRLWVSTLARRAKEGFDVSEAGARWLAYPKAGYFLPEHSFKVGRLEGAGFLYGSMDEAQAAPALLAIAYQVDHPGHEEAVWMLMNLATPESLRALKQINLGGLSPRVQENVRALLKRPDLAKPRRKPKFKRGQLVAAFEEAVNGRWDPFFDLVEIYAHDWEPDAVAVLQPDDLPLVRRARRAAAALANPHGMDTYSHLTRVLMALVWKPELVRD